MDLASLIDDAVERFGRWDIQPEATETKAASEDGMDNDSANELESDDEDVDMVRTVGAKYPTQAYKSTLQLSSPMSIALAELGLLNTSIPFQNLHKSLYPITRSLPLILHYKQTIANLIIAALTNPNPADVALAAPEVIDLIPSFVQCLSPDPDFKQLHLDTILSPLMKAIVALAVDPPSLHIKTAGDRGNDPNSPVEISKRAYQVFAWMLRQIGSDIVNGQDHENRNKIAWSWVVDGLSGNKPTVTVQEQAQEEVFNEEESAEDLDDLDQVEEPSETQISTQQLSETSRPVQEVDGLTSEEDELVDASDSETPPEDLEEPSHATARSSRRRPLSATRPHLRRLLSTCFAFLLRRAKNGENLDSIVRTVLASVQSDSQSELCESVSWLIIESVKSVETHIHSRGPAILRAVIRQTIELQSRKAIEILNAALTGILHHARLETVGTVSEVVLGRLSKIASEQNDDIETELTLNLVSVLSGTRRGARLADKEKSIVIACLEKMTANGFKSSSSSTLPLYVKAMVVALLNAPSLQCMLDSGRKLLERIWQLSEVRKLPCRIPLSLTSAPIRISL